MSTPTTWATDEPCPSCGTTLTLADDGDARMVVECRCCGYADTWPTGQPAGGDQ
jgi:ribosomal protein S27AE